mgnify:FL=1
MMNKIEISGKRIKDLRENIGFSQKNIAEFLGVDQSMISKVEKGERYLSSDMLDKLASLFGIQLKDFMNTDIHLPLKYGFRANSLTADDLRMISEINRIALNCDFLTSLLNGARINNGNQ